MAEIESFLHSPDFPLKLLHFQSVSFVMISTIFCQILEISKLLGTVIPKHFSTMTHFLNDTLFIFISNDTPFQMGTILVALHSSLLGLHHHPHKPKHSTCVNTQVPLIFSLQKAQYIFFVSFVTYSKLGCVLLVGPNPQIGNHCH